MTQVFDSPLVELPSFGFVTPAREAVVRQKRGQIRVLHLINGEHYAGAERVQDLLAANLPREGFEIGFACLKPDRFPQLRQSQASPVYALPMRSRFDLRIAAQLRRIVRCEGYRILHAHSPRTALPGRMVADWLGLPFVYHVHSPALRETTNRRRNWLNGLAERLSLRGDCRLIAVSSSLRAHMQRLGVDPRRIAVVPNGVPAPCVGRGEAPPGPMWTLGVMALFRPRKGLEVLLEAMAALRGQHYPVRLRAVGPFESEAYQHAIMDRVRSLGLSDAIRWAGFQKDVAAELRQMDLLVLPSLFGEGMPMVVLEAMAAGVPVVATRVEGVPEIIEDGVHGLLALPNDPADLARCLGRVVRGDVRWSELRQNGLSQHAERFSDRRMAVGVAEVYRQLLIAPHAAWTAAVRREESASLGCPSGH